MASDIRPPNDVTGKVRNKVVLKPGFGLMDWMRLPISQKNSREITKNELKQHNTRYDCWTALHGKVYNITQYLDYHPGGVDMLMKGGGKDCTSLFNKYHSWVNIDGLLSKCLIGILVDNDKNISITEDEEQEEQNQQDVNVDVEKDVKEEVTQEDVLQQLNNDDDEVTSDCHFSFSSKIRINPGLQNLAQGGTLHNVNEQVVSKTSTSDSTEKTDV